MPLQIIRQDISNIPCDAIVNTTNEEMIGYSGVDLAVHTRAGAELDAECRRLAPLELGFAKITKGYQLPCRYVIHTCGPVWNGGADGERAILKSCYTESLRLAKKYGCQTVAFPLISAGTYGFPKDQVMKHAVRAITEFLQDNEMTVYLCVFDRESYEFSPTLFDDIRSFIDAHYLGGHDLPYPAVFNFIPKSRLADSQDSMLPDACAAPSAAAPRKSSPGSAKMPLKDYVERKKTDGFSAMLFSLIDKSGMSDVECYKKANVDKKLFSKIKCSKAYKPSKQTAVAFAIALRLDLEQTKELLASAGIALTHNSEFDIIIEYFIRLGNYDIFEINEALFEFDQVLLGC